MPNDKSPEDRLKELKDQLQQKDSQIGQATKERDALKTDVDALTKNVDEIKSTTNTFVQAATGLDADVKTLNAYYHTKEQMVEAALGDKKKDADAAIKKVDDDIKTKSDEVAALDGKAAAAKSDYDAAKQDRDAKQQAYDSQKNRQKELGDNIKTLKDDRAKIEQYDDKNKTASMYVVLRELKGVLDGAAVPSPADFEKDLDKAWQELDKAKENVRQKTLAWESARDALAKAQAELKALEAGRVEAILKEVEPLNV